MNDRRGRKVFALIFQCFSPKMAAHAKTFLPLLSFIYGPWSVSAILTELFCTLSEATSRRTWMSIGCVRKRHLREVGVPTFTGIYRSGHSMVSGGTAGCSCYEISCAPSRVALGHVRRQGRRKRTCKACPARGRQPSGDAKSAKNFYVYLYRKLKPIFHARVTWSTPNSDYRHGHQIQTYTAFERLAAALLDGTPSRFPAWARR